MIEPATLKAVNIAKAYGGTQALRGVDFELCAGEVHALIGANGAGKSTLCKILAGVEQPSSGELWLDGTQTSFASVRDAAAQGVHMVHQELALFPDLTVTENLFLGREILDRSGLIDMTAQTRAAKAALERLGQAIDPGVKVGSLPIGLQQIVEITRALVHDVRILMMDEPTSALSRSEIPLLFEVIRGLCARGVAVIYISHRLDELLEVCDRITVLRDGQVVGAALCTEINPAWIVEQMTGRRASEALARDPVVTGDVLLSVDKLSLAQRPGRVPLEEVSMAVRQGEVVGLYGLMGAGRSEFFEALVGLHGDATGAVTLTGRNLAKLDISDRIAAGLVLVPEDRQRDGLVQAMSILQNMTLSSLAQMVRGGWLRHGLEQVRAQALAERLRIKLHTLGAAIGSLSGGNQQKVVISRCLMSKPKVLLLDEPTRGVDVAAKAEILSHMRSLAAEGVGVIFASSDASEILSASTRILVFSRGRIALEILPADADEATLAQAASVEAGSSAQELAA